MFRLALDEMMEQGMSQSKRASTYWPATTADLEAEAAALSSLAVRQARAVSMAIMTETSNGEAGHTIADKVAQRRPLGPNTLTLHKKELPNMV